MSENLAAQARDMAKLLNSVRDKSTTGHCARLLNACAAALEQRELATSADARDAERLRTVLEVFGNREDNFPLTDAERVMLAAFDERGSYTTAMKIAAIDAAMAAAKEKA